MATETTDRPKPVYVTFDNVTDLLGHLKEHGVPPSIDATAMPTGFGDGTRNQMLSALRYLGLIDKGGHAQQRLRDLVADYKTEAWPKTLRVNIERAYADVVGDLDLTTATLGMLRDAFGKVSHGQVQDKAMRFYQTALREAQVQVSKHLEIGAPGAAPGGARKPRAPRRAKPTAGPQTPPPTAEEKLPDDWMEYTFALRPDVRVKVKLPVMLTTADAARLHKWIDSLTFDTETTR